MALFMETTQINETKTVAEIQHLLSIRGASAVMINYEAGIISAVSFQLRVDGLDVPFRLPCRWKAVEAILRKRARRPRSGDTWEAWARRVAWRQILRWTEAQLAMVETGMVKTEEVFLPYVLNGHQQTMYEFMAERKFLAISGPLGKEGEEQ